MGLGLLIGRMTFGTLMALHGFQKAFGWFGGPGLSGMAAYLEGLGFRPGILFVAIDIVGESGGGILLALGLFEPVAAAAIVSVMLVAILTVHWSNGLFALTNGIELPLLYAAAASSFALTGPGRYSLDSVLGLTSWWTLELVTATLAAGIVAGLAPLVLRRVPRAVHASL